MPNLQYRSTLYVAIFCTMVVDAEQVVARMVLWFRASQFVVEVTEGEVSVECTLVMGARQLVVQDALDMTSAPPFSYSSWLTPMTYIGVASLGGAEMNTFLAPPAVS